MILKALRMEWNDDYLCSALMGKRQEKEFREEKPPRKRQKTFPYGNYTQYYGYRTTGDDDPRLLAMDAAWFADKSVLDIGCNSGRITRWIASTYKPWRIVGVDIDGRLIGNARKSLQKFAAKLERAETPTGQEDTTKDQTPIEQNVENAHEAKLEQISANKESHNTDASNTNSEKQTQSTTEAVYQPDRQFPNNISFKTANFVSDDFVETQKYDTILCLSVSKWIHLNWGDEGLMKLFRKVFDLLNPGGIFVLEPQPWESYRKKHKITETIRKTFHAIKLRPEQFEEVLLQDVGFASCRELPIEYPEKFSKGFSKRPVFVLQKPTL